MRERAQEVHAPSSSSWLLSGIERGPPQDLSSRRKSANPKPSFLWHLGLAGSELSRSISCLPLSTFGNTEVHGRGSVRTHLRRKRVCLTERCRAPQNGDTPLHLAAFKGHAAVVVQLLAAGAVTHAKTKVRWAGRRDADKAESRGEMRCVVTSVFSGFCWVRSRLGCKFGFLCLVKG